MKLKIVLGLAGSVLLSACVGLPYDHIDHAPQVGHRAPVIIDSRPAYYAGPDYHPHVDTIVIESDYHHLDDHYVDEIHHDPYYD